MQAQTLKTQEENLQMQDHYLTDAREKITDAIQKNYRCNTKKIQMQEEKKFKCKRKKNSNARRQIHELKVQR
jgi:hypothetical protein